MPIQTLDEVYQGCLTLEPGQAWTLTVDHRPTKEELRELSDLLIQAGYPTAFSQQPHHGFMLTAMRTLTALK